MLKRSIIGIFSLAITLFFTGCGSSKYNVSISDNKSVFSEFVDKPLILNGIISEEVHKARNLRPWGKRIVRLTADKGCVVKRFKSRGGYTEMKDCYTYQVGKIKRERDWTVSKYGKLYNHSGLTAGIRIYGQYLDFIEELDENIKEKFENKINVDKSMKGKVLSDAKKIIEKEDYYDTLRKKK